ncbi:MAG: DUF1697 domain-containing protein [Bacteroidetes bacterium]|nr:MAG: DUF1697 domain-containing protein [Bacteroidota bacterium]
MKKYIAILRGVNVSGHNIMPMKELKAAMEKAGFSNVATYIQSGNVVFEHSGTSENEQAAKLTALIKSTFGYDVPVLVRTVDYMKQVHESNPFFKREDVDTEKLHITFLGDEPLAQNIATANTYSYLPDEFIIEGKAVYVYCPNGYGNTKLTNTFFEGKLKVAATTRNLKTVVKLIEMGS